MCPRLWKFDRNHLQSSAKLHWIAHEVAPTDVLKQREPEMLNTKFTYLCRTLQRNHMCENQSMCMGQKTPWWSMNDTSCFSLNSSENDVLTKLLNYINCWFRTWLHRFFPASAWSWNWIYCPMSVCSTVLSRHAGPPVSSRQDAIFIV